ncbi:hypothetical protein HXP44_02070 [Streptomyces sioyaensis]|uniref:Uncharacterized protein n=1 Tax=Streptomyces sioyaensis TaxID=67364 RepID=A0A4Q1QZK0_9ACTN|nr:MULTISPECIES: hypothetical protein [Streptomyces]MBM4790882.1 hypothetical protein [Streptomyces sioyaensis]RXS67516.1 hypothetical protein EST54_11940 [Streptomyces sioyaensis]RXS83450.1 hypothetical protein EST92_14300 [Streptomyces sp. TM32]
MHAYDPSSHAYTHPIPGMRPSYEHGTTHTAEHGSATPIYDALYAEYRRSFRALPGDRTDEPETPEVLRGAGDWSRTAPTGHWEVVSRPPYHPRGHAPALPPARRDHRPHGH